MGTLFWVLVISVLKLFFAEGKHIHSFMGPYDVIFRSFHSCPLEDSGEDKLHVNVISTYDRKTKLPTFSGNVTIGLPVDDNLTAIIDYASSDPVGGWKPHALIIPAGPVVTAVKTFIPEIAEYVLENLDGGPYFLPLPPGTYTFNRKTFNGLGSAFRRKFPVFPYGEYRADLILHDVRQNPKLVKGCVRALLATVPKL